ncbi:holo-ACP synthase [Buchnera aphidicola (Formosaphis micheliae)]|uniref:holo-ACP synthase n=1 Tax=Buchnera aphidicola TaxID=9 RepID=UPI0031B81146
MAIVGIGIDIVNICRIKKIIKYSGSDFAKRILSDNEWYEYLTKKNKINFLAKHFSAKEAASKAFGTGMKYGIEFHNFEIYHDQHGKSKLKLLKNAQILAQHIGIKYTHINLTDEKKYACSIVIFEN